MKLHPTAKFYVCSPYQFRDNVPDRQKTHCVLMVSSHFVNSQFGNSHFVNFLFHQFPFCQRCRNGNLCTHNSLCIPLKNNCSMVKSYHFHLMGLHRWLFSDKSEYRQWKYILPVVIEYIYLVCMFAETTKGKRAVIHQGYLYQKIRDNFK